MLVRPATIQDAAALAHIQVDSYRTAYAGLMPAEYLARFSYEEQEQDWRDLLGEPGEPGEPGGDVLLVAENGQGELAGYALARPGSVEDQPAYDSELLALHVRRAWQRQGIGYALVSAVAGTLGRRGCTSLVLTVLAGNPARAFYEHLGGTPAGEKRWALDELDFEVVEVAYSWPDIRQLQQE